MTATSDRKRHALHLFQGLPARYDRMGAALSFGQDPRWRRALVEAVDPRRGQRILDVATGTGMVAAALARRGATVIGIDQSEAMLAVARARHGGTVQLVHGQAEQLPFEDGEFEAVTFTYLLRYVDDPAATLRELARVLRPGGRIGMVEFGVPSQPALRALWRVHTRVGLPLVGRAVSPAWYEVGRFLGPSIERFDHEVPDIEALWRAAGLRDVRVRRMSFGAGLVVDGIADREVAGREGGRKVTGEQVADSGVADGG